jgi:hypothetical protein
MCLFVYYLLPEALQYWFLLKYHHFTFCKWVEYEMNLAIEK